MTPFSVFNLNIMHGRNRRSAVFPPFVGREEIQDNLKKIIDCIHFNNPDIVTLQEVDEGSVFSGSFNQFEFIKEKLGYPYAYFASTCVGKLIGKNVFVTGNTIFSRYPLENRESFKFNFSFPTDRMGFVIADIKLPEGRILTVVSAHLVYLDWTRPHSRKSQLDIVRKAVEARGNSVMIAGDFNCDFLGKEDSLRSFVSQLHLKVFEPDGENMNTYPSWNPFKRIDYILPSRGLDLVSYKTPSDIVSDHLAVFAKFSMR